VFENCDVSGDGNGGGGIFSLIGVGITWNVRNTTMKSCTASSYSNGRGGGIYLNVTIPSANFRIELPSFERNDAQWGKNVFVMSPDLTMSITQSRFPFYPDQDGDVIEMMQGIASDGMFPMDVVELSSLLESITDTVIVSDGGIDSVSCGRSTLPCKSIQYSFDRMSGSDQNVAVRESVTLTHPLSFSSGTRSIYGTDEAVSFLIELNDFVKGEAGEGLITSSIPLWLEDLCISFPSTLNGCTWLIQ